MAVDSALLQKTKLDQEDEDKAGKEIRKGKKKGGEKAEKNEGVKNNNSDFSIKKTRPKLIGRRKKRETNGQEKKQDDTADSSSLSRPSKRFLRWSWISLVITGGTSIVLSLGYLNFHGFSRRVLPRFFCRFGDEWKPRGFKGKDPFSKFGTKGVGTMEVLTLIFLDFLAVAIFVIVLATILSIIIIIYKLFSWFTGFFT